MSDDIYVGFTEQPQGIDKVLKDEGFLRTRKKNSYEHGELGIDAVFRASVSERQKCPKWSQVPEAIELDKTVVADLRINSFGDEYGDAFDIANRIAEKYSAVIYDPSMDDLGNPGLEDEIEDDDESF